MGLIFLLPSLLLAFLIKPFGGLGMDTEGVLMCVVQFLGYFGLVWGIGRFRDGRYRFSLRGLLIIMTFSAIAAALIAWAINP